MTELIFPDTHLIRYSSLLLSNGKTIEHVQEFLVTDTVHWLCSEFPKVSWYPSFCILCDLLERESFSDRLFVNKHKSKWIGSLRNKLIPLLSDIVRYVYKLQRLLQQDAVLLVACRKLLFIMVVLDCSLEGDSFTVSFVKDAGQNNSALFCVMPKWFIAAHFGRVTIVLT